MVEMIPKLCLLVGCAALISVAHSQEKIFPYQYSQQDLQNGLRLIVVPTEFPNIVATYIVVRTGSRNEVEPGHTGFAHLFEHLMFRGTEKYPPEKYNQTLNRIGAASNASTHDDRTVYYTTFSKEDLETVLSMEADRFQHLKYAEPEFKTESLAVLGEYNKNSSVPNSKVREVMRDTAFDKHTYKHTTMGFLKDIQDMPNQYEYSLKFFDHYYRPEYTTIVVVGDANANAVRTIVEKYWGEWKHGSYLPDIPLEPPQNGPRERHVEWPSPTLPIVNIAFKAPAFTETTLDTAALDVLATLAFSRTSDLYQKLVVREQKVEYISAAAPRNVDAGLFEITARVKSARDLDYVREQILTTVKTFREMPVDTASLDMTRKRRRYEVALSMDNSDAIAEIVSGYAGLGRTPEGMNVLFEQYSQLTPEDVRLAGAKYLVEKGRTIVMLTGPDGAKGAAK
jgi:zinc protease